MTKLTISFKLLYQRAWVLKYMLLTNILIIAIIKMNPVYAIETTKIIGDQIARGNVNIAEQLLEMLRVQNVTNLNRIDEIVNTRILELNPESMYGIEHGEIHNVGKIPNESVQTILTWKDLALALLLAATFTISVYLIYKYWNEICDHLFGVVTHAVPRINPVQLALADRIEGLNDPELYRRIYEYFVETNMIENIEE